MATVFDISQNGLAYLKKDVSPTHTTVGISVLLQHITAHESSQFQGKHVTVG